MPAGRARITDLIDADASSPRYCGHSIGRVIAVEWPSGARYIHVQRVERSGDHVYGVGAEVSKSKAEALQMRWDVRWGLRVAPPLPSIPAAPKPDRPAPTRRFSDVDGAAAAIVAAGYRELAKRHHPDAGGDHMTMSLLTQAKRQLSQILDLAKGGA